MYLDLLAKQPLDLARVHAWASMPPRGKTPHPITSPADAPRSYRIYARLSRGPKWTRIYRGPARLHGRSPPPSHRKIMSLDGWPIFVFPQSKIEHITPPTEHPRFNPPQSVDVDGVTVYRGRLAAAVHAALVSWASSSHPPHVIQVEQIVDRIAAEEHA